MGGFFKKLGKEFGRVANQAVSVVADVPLVGDVLQGAAGAVGIDAFKEETHVSHAGTTSSPMVISPTTVTINEGAFATADTEELMTKLQATGISDCKSFVDAALAAETNTHKETKFFIPALDSGDNQAVVSIIGVETTKGETAEVSVRFVQLSATASVSASQVVHWRRLVKSFGHRDESTSSQVQARGLSAEEIKTVIATLTAAIEADPRYESLPGENQLNYDVEAM